MKKTKQQRRLQASNAAHERLRKRAELKDDEDMYSYHSTCIGRQKWFGRVLTRSERKEIYDYAIKTLHF